MPQRDRDPLAQTVADIQSAGKIISAFAKVQPLDLRLIETLQPNYQSMATELGLDWQRMFIGSDWSHLWAQLQPTRNAFDAANIDKGLSRAQLQPTRYAFDKVQTDYSRWMISSSVDDSW